MNLHVKKKKKKNASLHSNFEKYLFYSSLI